MGGRVVPMAYRFPAVRHVRKHGPAGWKDYQKYRPWLRDEFCFRCVYCLEREKWRDPRRAWHIDHFQPQVNRPDLECVYSNLLYLCSGCNLCKRSRILPDPCEVNLAVCLEFKVDGSVEFLNDDGEEIVEVLELDDAALVDYRRRKIGALLTHAKHNPMLYKEEISFPDDLPDLSEKPPKHNSLPEGVAQSWFELRKRKLLPDTY